jgi:hypothetical protein
MLSPAFKKLLLIIFLMATGAVLLLQLVNSQFKPEPQALLSKMAEPEFEYHYQPPSPRPVANAEAPAGSEDGGLEEIKIPRDKAEAWLAKHQRNAASLLAVFRALGDTNYLNEAATNFPNNPQVERSVLSHDAFPEDRRKWLDLFKTSSPSNSLANYLSAEKHFKTGNTDEAVKELLAASGKPQFQNYAMETQLDAEELYSASGKSLVETASLAISDMAEESLPELAAFKRLGQGIGNLEKQYIDAGDANSAVNLAQAGMTLANQIQTGDSGKYLINQLVGMADANIVLSKLDQNLAYDFLDGQTPAQVTEALKQQKTELRKLMADFAPAEIQMMTSESETANYVQRMKIYGELEAMKWVIQQHPPAAPQQ